MGLFRDLVAATGRAALSVLAKADQEQDEDEEGAGAPQPGAAPPAQEQPQAAQPAPVQTQQPQSGQASGQSGQMQLWSPDGTAMAESPNLPVQRTPWTLEALEQAISDPKGLFWDPFAVVDALGYKDRPSSITFQTLKAMTWQMPVVRAIIQQRMRQVSAFARPQVNKFSTGYRVVLRDRKEKATPASEARSQQLEKFLLTTGVTDNPVGRDNFDTFLQKYVQDSLMYDQACFQVVPARSGKPATFYAMDAGTIRIADTTRLFISPEDTQIARYVQIYDGLVIAEFSSKELSFGIRNPTSDLRNQGYGQSELEMLVTTITSLLWAWDYNQKFFSQGANIKGVINFKGPLPQGQLQKFRDHWYAMTAGVRNAFKTPIVNAPDEMQWISMQMSNKDMEYSAWMDFLIKLASGMYGMDPMEFNFKYGDSGAKSMFESANQSKLTASKDRGLKPLLLFAQERINTSVMHPLDENFELEFVGLEAQSPSEQADLITKQVKSYKTLNEVRAEEDLPPLPDGDIVLDNIYLQASNASKMAAQGGPPGMGGPPGADGGDDKGGGEDGGDDGGGGGFQFGGSDTDDGGDAEKSMRRVVLDVEV